MLEETKQLKASGDAKWEVKIKETFNKLKSIYAQYPESAEVFLYYAKTYFVADKMRKVNKSFKKAVYYNPNYLEVYVLQGDMNYTYGAKIKGWKRQWYKLDEIATGAYETAAQKSEDKNFQAMMYHKIGKVYDELSANQKKAKEYWQKAVSTAPDSEAAQLAGEKLSLHP